jgi:hypothetical protein
MSDYYASLSSISAVLGGFALTFLGVLLTGTDSRAARWTVRLSAAATSVLIVCALGWALAASATALEASVSAERASAFIGRYRETHRFLSLAFFVGIQLFLATLGTAGWMRGRSLGMFTTLLAAAGSVCVMWILSQFVS